MLAMVSILDLHTGQLDGHCARLVRSIVGAASFPHLVPLQSIYVRKRGTYACKRRAKSACAGWWHLVEREKFYIHLVYDMMSQYTTAIPCDVDCPCIGWQCPAWACYPFEHFRHVLNVPSNQPNRAANMDVK